MRQVITHLKVGRQQLLHQATMQPQVGCRGWLRGDRPVGVKAAQLDPAHAADGREREHQQLGALRGGLLEHRARRGEVLGRGRGGLVWIGEVR